MPSPETDTENPLALDARPAAVRHPRARLRRWLWTLLGLAVGIPVLLTLIGALTSPPHVKTVPVGHLIYLTADAPSEHTAMLRGLNILGADGVSRTLLHETEPQDTDSGSREWITQPAASPDGQQVAFIKEVITLQEEQQSVDNQLWVIPLYGRNPQPRMLLDLTKNKLKAPVGLAWTPDNGGILFLQDNERYFTSMTGSSLHFKLPPFGLFAPFALATTADVSATGNPVLTSHDLFAYVANTRRGRRLMMKYKDVLTQAPDGIFALSDSNQLAIVDAQHPNLINVGDWYFTADSGDSPVSHLRQMRARWGWSVFGRRHITSLKWSPDGRYIGYTVSKPPLEDELFYVDLATGKCYQLPVRPGAAAWDWAR